MPHEQQPATAPDPNDMRSELTQAGDQKLIRIVALLDETSQAAVPEAFLATLRTRLNTIRPPRKLRFARLLFAPFDDLIVAPLAWRPGEPTIPRDAIAPVTAAVRTALGTKVVAIDRMIAGHHTDATRVITQAGALLWAQAGELLANLPMEPEWSRQAELPAGVYGPLARAIAAVLRRADKLHLLALDADVGVVAPDADRLQGVLQGLIAEPPEGCTMVIRQLLSCLPDPALLARMLLATTNSAADKATLRAALERGVDAYLAGLNEASLLMSRLRHAPLGPLGVQMRRIAGLLQAIEAQPNAGRHEARLQTIRASLDTICRARFIDALRNRLLTALAGLTPEVTQPELEECASHLRALEHTGRRIGNRAVYDALLGQANEALRGAARSGRVSRVSQLRLTEILFGPDAADELYRQAVGPAATAVQTTPRH
jgi:hypothetical protein